MSDLTEFVLARVAEDEAVARAAGGEAWECAEYLGSLRVQTVATHGHPGYEEHIGVTHDMEGLSDSVDTEDGAHIARWDPARVLAECEAKRRILDDIETQGYLDDNDATDGLAWRVLRGLCLPYADNPDCHPDWRP